MQSPAVSTTTKARGRAANMVSPSNKEKAFEEARATEGTHSNMEIQGGLIRSSSRRTVTLLGETELVDRGLVWRIKWGERGVAVNAAVGLSIYIVNSIVYRSQSTVLFIGVAIFSSLMFASLAMIYYKNISFAITKRLLKEINVLVILGCGFAIFIIDCATAYNIFSPFLSFIYLFETILFVFLDALKNKSRAFVLSAGVLFVVLNMYNIFQLVFGGWHLHTVLFRYGKDLYFLKRPIKRSIFFQVLVFSFQGVKTMLNDKKMELMMFATGQIYRKTGTDIKYIDDEEEDGDLLVRNSVKLLGKDEQIDDHLLTRIKWGQRGSAVFAFIGMAIYFVNHSLPGQSNLLSTILNALVFAFAGLMFVSLGVVYFKNISSQVAKKLLMEVNVVAILALGVCIFIIDVTFPYNKFSWVMSLIYLLEVALFLFLDAVRQKHRAFVLALGIFFMLLNVFNAFELVFGNYYVGEILFEYSDEHVFYRRSVQRSIFIQIFMFSFRGLKIMFQDKEMELLMFVHGNIYRKTGTSSKYVEQESFVNRVRGEDQGETI